VSLFDADLPAAVCPFCTPITRHPPVIKIDLRLRRAA
jgi:hypothetical protein